MSSICGYGMIAVLTWMFLSFLSLGLGGLDDPSRMFLPESLLLVLCGVAWIVKANVAPGFVDPARKAAAMYHGTVPS